MGLNIFRKYNNNLHCPRGAKPTLQTKIKKIFCPIRGNDFCQQFVLKMFGLSEAYTNSGTGFDLNLRGRQDVFRTVMARRYA